MILVRDPCLSLARLYASMPVIGFSPRFSIYDRFFIVPREIDVSTLFLRFSQQIRIKHPFLLHQGSCNSNHLCCELDSHSGDDPPFPLSCFKLIRKVHHEELFLIEAISVAW